jgi:hypothetical protein
MFQCQGCTKRFDSQRGLNAHWQKRYECFEIVTSNDSNGSDKKDWALYKLQHKNSNHKKNNSHDGNADSTKKKQT